MGIAGFVPQRLLTDWVPLLGYLWFPVGLIASLFPLRANDLTALCWIAAIVAFAGGLGVLIQWFTRSEESLGTLWRRKDSDE